MVTETRKASIGQVNRESYGKLNMALEVAMKLILLKLVEITAGLL